MTERQREEEGINGTTTARIERGRSGRGWRVLLGALTGAVVGGFLGGNIANALSCHPYVNFCEFGALTGLFYGVLAGAVLGGVSGALIKSPSMVIPWFMLLGAFLGASVGIWTQQDRYAIGFVAWASGPQLVGCSGRTGAGKTPLELKVHGLPDQLLPEGQVAAGGATIAYLLTIAEPNSPAILNRPTEAC